MVTHMGSVELRLTLCDCTVDDFHLPAISESDHFQGIANLFQLNLQKLYHLWCLMLPYELQKGRKTFHFVNWRIIMCCSVSQECLPGQDPYISKFLARALSLSLWNSSGLLYVRSSHLKKSSPIRNITSQWKITKHCKYIVLLSWHTCTVVA